MSVEAEVINLIELDDIVELDTTNKENSNFGPGIELLMNDKKKGDDNNKASTSIDLDDITKLEDELNNNAEKDNIKSISKNNLFGNIFGKSDKPEVVTK